MRECPKCNLCFDDGYSHCPHDNETLFTSNSCNTTLSDRYVLERRLGKGGMASVYRARHKFLNSFHAVKIISPELVREDSELLIRFRQEAVLAASIHHTNVVAVTDYGVENQNTPYLVMEFIDGICLDDFLRRKVRLSVTEAYEILAPMGLGVGEAHSKGITHRDLKPLNIMIRNGYPLTQGVKVLDFGLAKIKASETFANLVQAKTTNVLGSPHYMSPEQWANEGVDNRSDIYSMGIILFQMLTGDVPFKGDSIPNIMYQHLQVQVPSLVSLGISVSPQIDAVIQKALAKDQNQRYATVEDFLYEYEKAVYNTSNQMRKIASEKTVSFFEESFSKFSVDSIPRPDTNINGDFSKSYDLTYLNSDQKQTLAVFLNQPKIVEPEKNEKLGKEFIYAQNQVELAQTKINEAEKLALEYGEAQKAAEDARQKALEAQKKLEADVRQRMQSEMDSKLAAEREAREKAEAEAFKLIQEVQTRKEAEDRAKKLAQTALEAQQRAEEERRIAEKEARKRQVEEGTRRKAEETALKLAEEVAEAKKRYEEAKRDAEYEAYYRMEAELKRKKVEEEIQRIAEYEAEKRRIVEAQAAQQIKEQASRLEKQALEAQQKADEARRLAETETKKRERAEAARLKAEEEARQLAEEIIEAQRRLEEAQQQAKLEAEKRTLEADARRKAEELALSSSKRNKENVESIKKDLMSQVEAAQSLAKSESEKRALEEIARRKAEELVHRSLSEIRRDSENNLEPSALINSGGIVSNLQLIPSGQLFTRTSSSKVSKTNRIPALKNWYPIILASSFFAFLLISGLGVILVYHFYPSSSTIPITSENPVIKNNSSSVLPKRILEKMILIKGGTFTMGKDVKPNHSIFDAQYPAHDESVDDFYIDRTEVTNEEFASFVAEKGQKAPEDWKDGKPPVGKEKFPVTFVSRIDAGDFADWVSKRNQVRCQLPTEEEWEYAARSGSKDYTYPWGNEWISNRANIGTHVLREVGTSDDETSDGKIQDMLGNVMEWTFDTFKFYEGFPKNFEAENYKKNIGYTVRGVSFEATPEELEKKDLLLTNRQGEPGDNKYKFLGFRLACHP